MSRTSIASAVAVCLYAAAASAQVPQLTVNVATAPVHKAPTTVSPVIGQAARGTTLDVTRDVGDWVKIAWSQSPEGIGYVRKSTGSIGVAGRAVPANAVPGTLAPVTPVAPAVSAVPAAVPAAPRSGAGSMVQAVPATAPSVGQTGTGPVVRPQPAAVPASYIATPSHRFGVGGLIGGSGMGGGLSLRGWTGGQRLGYQFEFVRYSMSNPALLTRMTSTHVGPKVLFALRDHVTDRTWLRPYVGGGAHVLRATMTDPVIATSHSDAGIAAQFFGGTEVTLSNMPRLGVSADAGYQWYQGQFPGYSLTGMTVTATAHWYLD